MNMLEQAVVLEAGYQNALWWDYRLTREMWIRTAVLFNHAIDRARFLAACSVEAK